LALLRRNKKKESDVSCCCPNLESTVERDTPIIARIKSARPNPRCMPCVWIVMSESYLELNPSHSCRSFDADADADVVGSGDPPAALFESREREREQQDRERSKA